MLKAKEFFRNMQNKSFKPELFFKNTVFVEALPATTNPVLIAAGGQDKKKWGEAKLKLEDYGVTAKDVAEQSKRMNLYIMKYECKLKKSRDEFDTMTREKIRREFYESEGLL